MTGSDLLDLSQAEMEGHLQLSPLQVTFPCSWAQAHINLRMVHRTTPWSPCCRALCSQSFAKQLLVAGMTHECGQYPAPCLVQVRKLQGLIKAYSIFNAMMATPGKGEITAQELEVRNNSTCPQCKALPLATFDCYAFERPI